MDLTELADVFVAFMQAFWLGILVIGAGISIKEGFFEEDRPPDRGSQVIDRSAGAGDIDHPDLRAGT